MPAFFVVGSMRWYGVRWYGVRWVVCGGEYVVWSVPGIYSKAVESLRWDMNSEN